MLPAHLPRLASRPDSFGGQRPRMIRTAITARAPRTAALGTRAAGVGAEVWLRGAVCSDERTSGAGPAGLCGTPGAEIDGAAPVATSAPHFVQNLVIEGTTAPHFVQNRVAAAAPPFTSRCAPHFVQNASCSASVAPHCLQLPIIADSAFCARQNRFVVGPRAQYRHGVAHFFIREIS